MIDQNVPKVDSHLKDEPNKSYEKWYGGSCDSACGRTDYPYDQASVEQLKQDWGIYLSEVKESVANNR
jgi:hypothetical protein